MSRFLTGIQKELDELNKQYEILSKYQSKLAERIKYIEMEKITDPCYENLAEKSIKLISKYILDTYSDTPFFKLLEDIFGEFPKDIEKYMKDTDTKYYRYLNMGELYFILCDDDLNYDLKKIYDLNVKSFKRIEGISEQRLRRLFNVEFNTDFYLINDEKLILVHHCFDCSEGSDMPFHFNVSVFTSDELESTITNLINELTELKLINF